MDADIADEDGELDVEWYPRPSWAQAIFDRVAAEEDQDEEDASA